MNQTSSAQLLQPLLSADDDLPLLSAKPSLQSTFTRKVEASFQPSKARARLAQKTFTFFSQIQHHHCLSDHPQLCNRNTDYSTNHSIQCFIAHYSPIQKHIQSPRIKQTADNALNFEFEKIHTLARLFKEALLENNIQPSPRLNHLAQNGIDPEICLHLFKYNKEQRRRKLIGISCICMLLVLLTTSMTLYAKYQE